jgi:hypothetical protein
VFCSVPGSVKRVGIDLGLRFTWVFRRVGDASSYLTFSRFGMSRAETGESINVVCACLFLAGPICEIPGGFQLTGDAYASFLCLLIGGVVVTSYLATMTGQKLTTKAGHSHP